MLSYLIFMMDCTWSNSIGLDSSISYSVKMTLVWLIMSLSYQLLVIDRILYGNSWLFSSVFGVDRTYTISHVVVLFGFCLRPYLVGLVLKAQFYFCDRPYPVLSVMIVKVLFCRRPHLYDQSCHCHV